MDYSAYRTQVRLRILDGEAYFYICRCPHGEHIEGGKCCVDSLADRVIVIEEANRP